MRMSELNPICNFNCSRVLKLKLKALLPICTSKFQCHSAAVPLCLQNNPSSRRSKLKCTSLQVFNEEQAIHFEALQLPTSRWRIRTKLSSSSDSVEQFKVSPLETLRHLLLLLEVNLLRRIRRRSLPVARRQSQECRETVGRILGACC